MRNKLILLSVLIISLAILAFVILKLPSQNTQTQIQPKSKTSVLYESKTDEKGSVVVEVKPLSLIPKDNVSFNLTFTTHSGDLSYDIAAIAKLQDDKGNTSKALSWTGGKGGHHLSGILTFPKLSEDAWAVTLTISGIDNQDRIFEWELN
ncbi:MAG: hypothetical protein HY344_00135 [Candidatus Levybacteria bacterium]|nr:hypothetical protein [Candidatus Levybacteria bacterium]